MRVSELRIGNLVKSNKSNCNYKKGLVEIDLYTFNKILHQDGLSGLESIPLTEEWLVKFGFKKHTYENYYGHKIELEFKGKYLDVQMNFMCSLEDEKNLIYFNRIKHVHQLQNLYFTLTGKELIL